MSKRKKTVQEIASSFHVCVTEIGRLFGCGRVMADQIFDRARNIDRNELRENYLDEAKVRLTSVLRVMGISEEELRRKVPTKETE